MNKKQRIAAVTASAAAKSITERLTVTGYQIPDEGLEIMRAGIRAAIETGIELAVTSVKVHNNER